jgi:hypothetical protein
VAVALSQTGPITSLPCRIRIANPKLAHELISEAALRGPADVDLKRVLDLAALPRLESIA